MSLTQNARHWMSKRDELTIAETEVIDAVFAALYKSASENNVKAATDDRAAEVEAVLVQFIFESKR